MNVSVVRALLTLALLSLIFALFSAGIVLAALGARGWHEILGGAVLWLFVILGSFWLIMLPDAF